MPCIMNMHGVLIVALYPTVLFWACLHKHFSCSTISMYFLSPSRLSTTQISFCSVVLNRNVWIQAPFSVNDVNLWVVCLSFQTSNFNLI